MSRPLHADSVASSEARPYLTFWIGEVLYAVSMDQVDGHRPMPSLDSPQPDDALTHDDSTYIKVEPRSLFQIPTPPPLDRHVIFHRSGAKQIALVVDRLFHVLDIDPRRFQPIPWHFGGREQLWFEGATALDADRPLVLLRPQGLAASSGAGAKNSHSESKVQKADIDLGLDDLGLDDPDFHILP